MIARAALGPALAAGVFAMLAAAVAPAQAAQKASLDAPGSVAVGRTLTLTARGFPANSVVTFGAALHGPAAYSGRRLGRARTDGAGRARLRRSFPSTYRWCNADRECKTYKWPKGARIALTAQATEPTQVSVRKVVPLRRRSGRSGGSRSGYRNCSGRTLIPIPGASNAHDIATQIKARNMSCGQAKRVIRAPATDRGYRCSSRARRGKAPRITCTKGSRAVRFTYIQY